MINYFIQYTSVLSTVLVSIVLIVLWNKYGIFDRGLIYFYFLIAGITEIIVTILSFYAIYNIELLNYFFIVEFLLLYASLIMWLNFRRVMNVILLICGICIFLIFTIDQFNFNFPYKFNVGANTLFSLILIGLSIQCILRSSKNDYYVFTSEKFWFTLAIFFHFTLGMIVMATSEISLDGTSPMRKNSWIIYMIINIITNLVYLKGLFCISQRMKNYTLH